MSAPATLELAAAVVAGAAWRSVLPLALGGLCARPRLGAGGQHAVWSLALGLVPVLGLQAAVQPGPLVPHAGLVVGAWVLGVVVALAVPLAGLVELARLTRAGRPFGTTPGGAPVRLADVAAPLTWGAWRPVVLLPRAAADWAPADRALALAHEQAHIDRRDWLVHALGWAVCGLFWFQPLAWWARRRLAEHAEDAVDDVILARGVRPAAYARLLLGVAAGAPSLGLSVAGAPVARRVRRVLAGGPRPDRRLAALALGLVPAVALLFVARALAPPSPPADCQVAGAVPPLRMPVEVLP